MARTDRPRHIPAIPHRQVVQHPGHLPVGKQHAWINDQTDEKAAIAAQEAALGAFGAQANTAMVTHNANVTIRGVTAIEGMRGAEGSPRFYRLVGGVADMFQGDLVESNRLITNVASENIAQGINRPFQKPAPKPKEPGLLDVFFGDDEGR